MDQNEMEKIRREKMHIEEPGGSGRALVPLAELEGFGPPEAEARYKSIVPSVILVAFGAMMLFLSGMAAKIGGFVFAGCGLFGMLGVRDHVAAKVYETSVTLIDNETGTGINIPYSDIQEWNVDNGLAVWTKTEENIQWRHFPAGRP